MQSIFWISIFLLGCSDTSDGKDGDVNNENVVEEPDSDGDGLTDAEETELGTDPNKADTDDDGRTDKEEVDGESDPLVADADEDGLNDGEEFAANTDPNNADTDGDGAADGLEVERETDPNDPTSFPIKPDDGDWLLTNTNVLQDDCNLQSVLNTFGTDIFAVLPDDYTVVNSTYESFQIEISSGNANCPIEQSGFLCETLSINEEIDDVGITISADMNLEGVLFSGTVMNAVLSATLTNCDGAGCALLSLAGVNIPCDVRIEGEGNL